MIYLVCINNDNVATDLDVGKSYKVVRYHSDGWHVIIKDEYDKIFGFKKDRFVTLNEWREIQLDKLIEIK